MTPATVRHSPKAPVFAGVYRIRELIAEGAHGPIYRGTHRHSEGEVALQFLADPDPDRYDPARFAVAHPALLPVLMTGVFAGLPFVATAMAFGPTFLGRFDATARSPIDSARFVLAVADAVALLHANGIVHLRLAPHNIVVDREQPVLLDLGTARHLHGGRVTTTRLPADRGFAAPEQHQLGADLTPATDVYQLGALLHTAWLGRTPDEHPAPVRARHIPRALAAVCDRALRCPGTTPFADAGAFVSALQSALEDHADKVHARDWLARAKHFVRACLRRVQPESEPMSPHVAARAIG